MKVLLAPVLGPMRAALRHRLCRGVAGASAIALLLVGCASPRPRLEPAAIDAILLGTPKAQIDQQLGKPDRILAGREGKVLAYYRVAEQSGGGFGAEITQKSRVLSLRYNQNLHLERKLFHESDQKYKPHFWTPDIIGKPLKLEEIVAHIHVGDTRRQVLEGFGTPTMEVLSVDGGTVMTWVAGKERPSLGLVRRFDTQTFGVWLDDDGVVRDFKLNGSFDPTDRDVEKAPK